MKALSLKQPWASLVANGSKHFETRSWATPYRGPIAIHASKAIDGEDALLTTREPFASALNCDWRQLPTGAVIATALLTDCLPIDSVRSMLEVAIFNGDPEGAARRELAFGNYTPGRFGWLLEAVAPLPEPVEMRGMLSLWETIPHPSIELAELQLLDVAASGGGRCRSCGCTDNVACNDGCGWVEDDLCSACAPVGSVVA